jgi:uncharacterized protein YkwD
MESQISTPPPLEPRPPKDPLTNLGRLGIALMVAGVLTLSSGLIMAETAAGSSGLALNGLGVLPSAPLDPTATSTSTPEPSATPQPTATPEPDTPTPEPPTPEPTDPPPPPPPPTSTPRPAPAPTRAPAPPAAPPVSLSGLEQQLYGLQNNERTKAGLAGLALDPTLEAIARQRASDMAAKNYFAHTSPTGETAFSIMESYHYYYSIAGENIARNNYPDDQSASIAMTGFMNSPSHRANVLDSRYSYVGIGLAFGPDGMKYFAVVFAGK